MSDIIKAIPCPRCKQLFSENQNYCPNCGFRPTNSRFTWQKYLIAQDLFTSLIVYSNILVFSISIIWTFFSKTKLGFDFFGFPTPSLFVLEKLGGLYKQAIFQGEFYRFINYLFLHGNLLHLAFNTLWFCLFRRQLKYFPASILFLIYFVSGLSSGVAACLFAQNALTIGSSGSVFGLLGALLAYARKRKDMLGFLLWKQFSFLAFILILSGFLFSNVSNSGHIGGILGGFLFTYFVVLGNIPQKNTILKFLTFLFYGAIGWGTITVFLYLLQ